MVKKKKYRSIEQLKSRYGYGFTAIWVIGFILFFAIPVVQSLIYAFSNVAPSAEGIKTDFVGFKNFNFILNEHPDYTKWLAADLSSILYSMPIILLVSVVLALLLNQKFRGRIIFRAVYFIPVIIATGAVLKLMFSTTSEEMTTAGVSSTITGSMFSIEDVVGWLNIPDKVAQILKSIIDNIFDLLWSCGIQTVLFIAGLQSIPSTLYEASRVEGATKWEEFWFITFPSLGSVTLLVAVYTMVDVFTNTRNQIIEKAYGQMSSGIYDTPSAMLWTYFAIVGIIMGIVLFLYNRFLLKRWQ